MANDVTMESTLADIVLQNLEFFSLAPDSDIHPDVAVRQLEIVASHLKGLPETELKNFFRHAEKRLQKLRDEGASKEQLKLLENLRECLGV